MPKKSPVSNLKQELKYLLGTLAMLICIALLCVVFPAYLLASGLYMALGNMLSTLMDDFERVKVWAKRV